MAHIQANGLTIEYEIQGEGEPLLLVMGLSGQLVGWPRGFVDALVAQGFRVITFDNRDIGLSTQIAAPTPTTWQLMIGLFAPKSITSTYHLSDMAADAVGLLAALGIDSAHVVGISMGGMIGQCIAIDHPTRIRSLTSIMSTTGNRRVGRSAFSLIAKLPRLTRVTRSNALEKGVELFRHISGTSFDEAEARELGRLAIERSFTPDGTQRQTAAILASPDRTEMLHRVTTPTLVIHGLGDTLVSPSGGMATARAIPASRLLMFPEMGHNLPKGRWAEIVDAIVDNTRRWVGGPARLDEGIPAQH
jgi:pimeloyl-ACP methyl ester carboxylesterase